MVRRCWLLLLTLGVLTVVLDAQGSRPVYDPETKDGLLIQHIQQETDPAQKLRYMEEFVAEYPKHQAAAWVYDQLQPAYFRAKSWDGVIRIGALRLAVEPENLEAAELALRAAESRQDTAQIVEWADRVWPLANTLAARGGAEAAVARQTASYAESLEYSIAAAASDPAARLEMLEHFQQHMPSSKYAQGLTAQYFEIYRQMKNEEKAAEMAARGLESDPGNAEMLVFLAELHARRDTPQERQQVIVYASRALESVEHAPRPAAMSEADWDKRKAVMIMTANYLGGVSSSLNQNYAKADLMLRAAVASMEPGDPRLPAALYHLGMANYRLAEAGHDRNRPVDSLRFLRRCAAIRSPFQEQAAKNIAGIKAEYSLP